MAQTGHLTQAPHAATPLFSPVTWLRIAIIATLVVLWELAGPIAILIDTVKNAILSAVGAPVTAVGSLNAILAKVTPSLLIIGQSLLELLGHADLKWPVAVGGWTHDFWIPAFYWHLYVTIAEVAVAVAIGGLSGLVVGLLLGGNPFLSGAFERYLYYLGPTPKIVFFPIMIMWFGVGPESKIAMGTMSCFFPVALSVAAGMRQIENVLIRVGRSFRLSTWQMVTKIYLPAMREPIINGVRLGMGVALIGVLLAETKLSNRGIGFMIIDAYNTFDMPRMYAALAVLFVLAIGANALVSRASRAAR
jgi:ABC-type nitrate/sulfonate/bicarbonate transport system permease component